MKKSTKPKSLKILFCSAEVAPFAKTGGLADVAGSLPLALGELGHEVVIAMPKYRGIKETQKKLSHNVTVWFVENDEYFDRGGLYGDEKGDFPDNLERFAFYCRRSLELAKERGFRPDIVHNHEWQTGLIAIDLKTTLAADPFFKRTRTVFTIHNLAYQGLFPLADLRKLGLRDSVLKASGIEFWGRGNLMKGALVYSDMLTTVSPTYAKEIRTRAHGCGLESILKKRSARLKGIVNGIDASVWDPETDPKITRRYSFKTPWGKADNKHDLQVSCGLMTDATRPLFGIVSRLVEQKGFDLLAKTFDEFMEEPVQFVILGTGEEKYHKFFQQAVAKYPGRVAAVLKFDGVLAQKIYAGSDFFLMPSRFEPCGLGQLIAIRYGSVPLVHRVGGLADTVTDVAKDAKNGNGFVFAPLQEEAFLATVRRAVKYYGSAQRFARLQSRIMRQDLSWKKSARAYDKLYRRTLRLPRRRAS